jgi:hypothetical protein
MYFKSYKVPEVDENGKIIERHDSVKIVEKEEMKE